MKLKSHGIMAPNQLPGSAPELEKSTININTSNSKLVT